MEPISDFLVASAATKAIMADALITGLRRYNPEAFAALREACDRGALDILRLVPQISDPDIAQLLRAYYEACLMPHVAADYDPLKSEIAVEAYEALVSALWAREESIPYRDLPPSEMPLPTPDFIRKFRGITASHEPD